METCDEEPFQSDESSYEVSFARMAMIQTQFDGIEFPSTFRNFLGQIQQKL